MKYNGLQVEDFDMEVEDEEYDIQKPHIWSNENEEQMEDGRWKMVNIILILELHMTNKSVNNN